MPSQRRCLRHSPRGRDSHNGRKYSGPGPFYEEKFELLLFEDHKVSGTGFVLPENVYVISTRAFLARLEVLKLIPSAQEISNAAVTAGRNFSQREVDQPAKGAPDVKPF